MFRSWDRVITISAIVGSLVAMAQSAPVRPLEEPAQAQSSATGSGRLQVLGLEVHRPLTRDLSAGQNYDKLPWSWSEGATVEFAYSDRESTFIGYDCKATHVTAATDDRGTSLLPAVGEVVGGFSGSSGSRANESLVYEYSPEEPTVRISFLPGGHAFKLEANLPLAPAIGWRRIRLEGQAVLYRGSRVATAEQTGLNPYGGTITVGPVPLQFAKAPEFFQGYPDGHGQAELTSLTLHHDKPFYHLVQMCFKDASGHTIPEVRRETVTKINDGEQKFETRFTLKGRVEPVSVEMTYFEVVETITIPLNIVVGFGAGAGAGS